MSNIYNAIQNLYNMDKTTWQEVLAELYNLVSNVDNKFDLFENKFGPLLGKEVTRELKKMYNNGSLAALINDKLLKDINTKVDAFKTKVSEQLDNNTNKVNDIAYNIKDFYQASENNWSKAIKRAINKSITDGNRKVYAPAGKYLISEPIYCNEAIEFFGAGDTTVFVPTRDFDLPTDIKDSKINNEFGAIFIFTMDNNTKIKNVEGFIDNLNLHDFVINGNKRKYKADAIHLNQLDHSHFYNLKIEEFNGSAMKLRYIRESDFINISTRYCGKVHLDGESEYTKGHPSIEIKPTNNDTSNLNHWLNVNVMCSYYTSLRLDRTNNTFTNCTFHSAGSWMDNLTTKGFPPLPVIDGEKCNYDVVQVINTYDTLQLKNTFSDCSIYWAGATKSQIYIENSVLFATNVIASTHWIKSDKSITGYGITCKNAIVFAETLDIGNNPIMFRDLGNSQLTFGNGIGYQNSTFNTDTSNIQNWDLKSVRQNINVNCYNLFKNQPMNFITDGKYDGSSRTYHTTFRKATDLSVLAYLSTLNSGKTLFAIKNGQLLLDKQTSMNTDKWKGSIWHDNDGFIKVRDNSNNGNEWTLSKAQYLQEVSSLPSLIPAFRGKIVLLQQTGKEDKPYLCIQNADGNLEWKPIALCE